MFRPQIQKTRVLSALAAVSLLMVYISSNSTITDIASGYEYKMQSAEIMDNAIKILKKEVKNKGYTIYKDIDPNTTGLIFKEDSPVRTG